MMYVLLSVCLCTSARATKDQRTYKIKHKRRCGGNNELCCINIFVFSTRFLIPKKDIKHCLENCSHKTITSEHRKTYKNDIKLSVMYERTSVSKQ